VWANVPVVTVYGLVFGAGYALARLWANRPADRSAGTWWRAVAVASWGTVLGGGLASYHVAHFAQNLRWADTGGSSTTSRRHFGRGRVPARCGGSHSLRVDPRWRRLLGIGSELGGDAVLCGRHRHRGPLDLVCRRTAHRGRELLSTRSIQLCRSGTGCCQSGSGCAGRSRNRSLASGTDAPSRRGSGAGHSSGSAGVACRWGRLRPVRLVVVADHPGSRSCQRDGSGHARSAGAWVCRRSDTVVRPSTPAARRRCGLARHAPRRSRTARGSRLDGDDREKRVGRSAHLSA